MASNDNIEEYIKEKGRSIGRILIACKYDDIELEFPSIEEEIYEVAICYARIYFFETQSFLLKEESEKRLKFLIQTRFDIKQRKLKKMSNVDLVAHCIKLEAIEELERAGLVIS
ncbi:hypothetical protein GW943_03350 [Candidatus Parcubacteria bacterium]|uniref:Uncharacterized protein n=1 Tax=Candidatus Kaiserbacteria bacterium CG10_big_fil_rev_8_21_14_0_10_47_16 TaxID=1974608 RepID=A0A2H0UG98_9BACT|nr:hypothetical protein [Candidatus Parcubacteria bacterium]PIR84825.1 MAG: hypothetical protein COU16_00350 [Candidatus Kaiserbacteria bacterium CG10_big_fil_rev_8_21_14_0_10_47_16]